MSAQEEQRLRMLFDAACQHKPAARNRFLSDECADDPELRQRVEALLASDRREGYAFEASVLTDEGKALLAGLEHSSWERRLPDRLGRYRVVREIGSGSMGTVFEAKLESSNRTVALKVLRPGVSTASMLRRFRFEASVLKRLDHPFVAKFYDSGTTDAGHGPQPFFAMELVAGRPINDFAQEQALSTRSRLELLAKVSDAVHHAHTKGVIHRDIKPSNVLVDSEGRPRILDFGVARATQDHLGTQTDGTATGQLVGTLRYMSPEQAVGEPDDIDTRCDIYALGVIGFELLGGKSPYEISRKSIPESVRIICESTPPRLGAVRRGLRGDVETIIAKAMEKEKDRRYQSASDLSADIRRHLNDEPIIARPPSIIYQLSKYAKRNKGWFLGGVTSVMALTLGVAGTGYGAFNAMEQRAIAERSRAEAEASRDQSEVVTRVLGRMLESVSPEELGRDVLVRDVLEEASRMISAELADLPLVEAHLRHTLGTSYMKLDDLKAAQLHLDLAQDIRNRVLGPEHPDTLRSGVAKVTLYLEQEESRKAESLLRPLLQTYRRVLGDRHPDTLLAFTLLPVACHYQGRLEEAESLYQEVLTLQCEVFGDEHEETMDTLHNLAVLYTQDRRFEEAAPILRRVLKVERARLGAGHPSAFRTVVALARLQQEMLQYEEAAFLFREVLDARRRALGERHSDTRSSMILLGKLYLDWGHLAEAETVFLSALQLQQEILGPEAQDTLAVMNLLALLRHSQGRFDDAEAMHLKILEIQLRTLGEKHPMRLRSMNSLANLYCEQDRYDEAEALHKKALTVQRRELGQTHEDTLDSMHNLACLHILQSRPDEAEPLCAESLDARRQKLGEEHPDTLISMNTLAILYEAQGRNGEAESLYKKILDIQRRILGENHEQVLVTTSNLGDLYNSLERFAEADRALRSVVAMARKTLPERHWQLGSYLVKHAKALAGLERLNEAEELLVEAQPLLIAAFGTHHHRTVEATRALADVRRAIP